MLKALQVHNRYRCNTCDRFYERHTCYNRHRSAADPTKLTSLTMLTNPTTLTKLTNITKYSTIFLTYICFIQTRDDSKQQ